MNEFLCIIFMSLSRGDTFLLFCTYVDRYPVLGIVFGGGTSNRTPSRNTPELKEETQVHKGWIKCHLTKENSISLFYCKILFSYSIVIVINVKITILHGGRVKR